MEVVEAHWQRGKEMKCEAHDNREAAIVYETACCKVEVPWCAQCAFGAMDWLAKFGSELVDCRHCDKTGIVARRFLVATSR